MYSIDNGDTLHDSLKANSNVVYFPDIDTRKLRSSDFKGDKIDVCLIDVTFVSLEEVLTTVWEWLSDRGEVSNRSPISSLSFIDIDNKNNNKNISNSYTYVFSLPYPLFVGSGVSKTSLPNRGQGEEGQR